jgi:8-oxo-dGTP pyrophosphatase MutT (NUDIX family)
MKTIWSDVVKSLIIAGILAGLILLRPTISRSSFWPVIAVLIPMAGAVLLALFTHWGRWIAEYAFAVPAYLFLTGFRGLARFNKKQLAGDTLWNWITSQILVAQNLYAFSASCLVMRKRSDVWEVLLVHRKDLPGFRERNEEFFIWPGGRILGADLGLVADLKRRVLEETGCKVAFINLDGQPQTDGVIERARTFRYGPDGKPDEHAENVLLLPPFRVMQQDRAQRNDVRGHIDLIFLAVQEDDREPDPAKAAWVSLTANHSEARLWPDTRACAQAATAVFLKYFQSRPTAPA